MWQERGIEQACGLRQSAALVLPTDESPAT